MEKIRITSDDVARARDGESGTEPPYPPINVAANRRAPLVIGSSVGAIVVVLALLFIVLISNTRDITVDEWKVMERKQLNAELSTSPKLKPYVEGIHPFVTFTGANIKSITATTIDGSNRAGKAGSNISELEFVVTYHWYGPVQENGYTEVLYVWDWQAKKLKKSRYLDSTAVVNLDNIDWFKVGMALAPLFFGGK